MPKLITTRYLILRPDTAAEAGSVEWPEEPKYDAICKMLLPLLDGQKYIERVRVLAPFDGSDLDVRDMMIGERSAVDDFHILNNVGDKVPVRANRRNEVATEHYRHATLMGRTLVRVPSDPEEIPAIYGPAVLFERRIWF